MADAKPAAEKHEPPRELPYGAQTQKTLGKAKRSPDDQAEYFYNIRNTHILFFVSSFAMLVSLVLMFVDDYAGVTPQANREWKQYQKTYAQMDFAKLQEDIRKLEERLNSQAGELGVLDKDIQRLEADLANEKVLASATVKVLEERVDEVEQQVSRNGWKVEKKEQIEDDKARRVTRLTLGNVSAAKVTRLKDSISAEHYDKQMLINFANGDRLVVRWRFEEAEHHLREARKKQHGVDAAEQEYRRQKEEWDRIVEDTRLKKESFDEVDWRMALYDDLLFALREPLTKKTAERTRIRKDYEEKIRRYKNEKPQPANEIRNAPMMDFFDPTIKIKQVVLTAVQEDFHFVKIERVERCHTCHVGIANPAYAADINPSAEHDGDRYRFRDEFLQLYVDHATGRTKGECGICSRGASGKLTVQVAHGAWTTDDAVKYTKVLMAHPRLDLFVAGASPHALERVGCTSCHEGDGRETEFSRAVHMPSSEHQTKQWESRHRYHYRELWDRPMLPKQHVYASCRKCHREQVELPGSGEYQKGMLLYERAGCYACHRTDTYQILPKDTNDPKMDPNRKMRRPGPPLTHVADKLSQDWSYKWVLNPKDFRHTTRMPRFFGQSNARTITVPETLSTAIANAGTAGRDKAVAASYPPEKVEAAQAATMVEYLFAISQTRNYASLPALAGSAARGEALFEQIGCRACHVTTPDEQYGRRVQGVLNADDTYRAPEGTSTYLSEFAPNLSAIGTKMGAGTPHEAKGRAWLFHWTREPDHYFAQTRMPKLRHQGRAEMDDQEVMDLVEYMMSRQKPGWASDGRKAEPDPALLAYLVYEQLRLKMPDVDALDELGRMKKTPDAMRLWFGRKMIVNFGCYSCHELRPEDEKRGDIARLNSRIETPVDWTNAEGIGVELTGAQPEGVKAVDRLDFGYTHVDEKGNHRGVSFRHGFTGQPYKHVDPANENPDVVRVNHFRHDWLRNKLLDPRVFDGGKLNSKPPDELLRMPNFYFSAEEVRALTTFLLSFTDHDIPTGLVEGVKKRFSPDELALNRGERLIRENNCRACHRFQLDKFEVEHTRTVKRDDKEKEVTTYVWIEGRVKEVMVRADVEKHFKAWGFPISPRATILSMAWTTDARTLRHEPGNSADGRVKDLAILAAWSNPLVAFDGRDWWLVEGNDVRLVGQKRIRNHVPMEGGDIIGQIRDYKLAHAADFGLKVTDPGEFENRIPPMLRTQGSKTQAEWLFEFLRSPSIVRPALQSGTAVRVEYKPFADAARKLGDDVDDDNAKEQIEKLAQAAQAMPADSVRDAVTKLIYDAKSGIDADKFDALVKRCREVLVGPEIHVRMPTFGFSEEEAAALVKYFWARDFEAGRNPYPYTSIPERDPANVQAQREAMRAAEKNWVVKDTVCGGCHVVGGVMPGDTSVSKLGPEFAHFPRRLQPRWLKAWMAQPADIYPGTTMPQNRLGNDERGLIEYMLNFDRVGPSK